MEVLFGLSGGAGLTSVKHQVCYIRCARHCVTDTLSEQLFTFTRKRAQSGSPSIRFSLPFCDPFSYDKTGAWQPIWM